MPDRDDNPATSPAKPDVKATRTEFATHLLTLDKGRVHDDATERLAELTKAVERCGGAKGTMTIKITVEAQDAETFHDTGVVILTGEVELKKPLPKRAPTIFYGDGTGQLSRQDPRGSDDY
jgi:hypothetical protein